MKKNITNRQV